MRNDDPSTRRGLGRWVLAFGTVAEMTEDQWAVARRGLAKVEAAVAALAPEEIDAIRALAESAPDKADEAPDVDDVEAFGMRYGPASAFAPDLGGDVFAVMMAYQRIMNREAREDRQTQRASREIDLLAPWKP